jgi:hypothetical protein
LDPDATVWVEFEPPVDYPRAFPVISNHYTRLNVVTTISTPNRSFDLLCGPAPGDDFGRGEVDNDANEPRFLLVNGFVLLAGSHSVGRTTWVRATGLGTTMAMRVTRDSNEQVTGNIIYNLTQDTESSKLVEVQRNDANGNPVGPIVSLPRGFELRVTSATVTDPLPAPQASLVTDAFIERMKALAVEAEITLD